MPEAPKRPSRVTHATFDDAFCIYHDVPDEGEDLEALVVVDRETAEEIRDDLIRALDVEAPTTTKSGGSQHEPGD